MTETYGDDFYIDGFVGYETEMGLAWRLVLGNYTEDSHHPADAGLCTNLKIMPLHADLIYTFLAGYAIRPFGSRSPMTTARWWSTSGMSAGIAPIRRGACGAITAVSVIPGDLSRMVITTMGIITPPVTRRPTIRTHTLLRKAGVSILNGGKRIFSDTRIAGRSVKTRVKRPQRRAGPEWTAGRIGTTHKPWVHLPGAMRMRMPIRSIDTGTAIKPLVDPAAPSSSTVDDQSFTLPDPAAKFGQSCIHRIEPSEYGPLFRTGFHHGGNPAVADDQQSGAEQGQQRIVGGLEDNFLFPGEQGAFLGWRGEQSLSGNAQQSRGTGQHPRKGLKKYTPSSVVDECDYVKSLGAARRDGYAVDEGEFISGLKFVAMSLEKFKSLPLLMWGIGFSSSMPEEKTGEIASRMTAIARKVKLILN